MCICLTDKYFNSSYSFLLLCVLFSDLSHIHMIIFQCFFSLFRVFKIVFSIQNFSSFLKLRIYLVISTINQSALIIFIQCTSNGCWGYKENTQFGCQWTPIFSVWIALLFDAPSLVSQSAQFSASKFPDSFQPRVRLSLTTHSLLIYLYAKYLG